MQELSLDYRQFGRDHLSSMLAWSRTNEKLLRSHVFSPIRTPEVLDVLQMDEITGLTDWSMEQLRSDPELLDQIVPDWRRRTSDQLEYMMGGALYATLQDAAVGSILGSDLSFIQGSGGRLYRFWNEAMSKPSGTAGEILARTAALQSLELPEIDDVPDKDFIGIRLHSEDFHEFRDVLNRSLRATVEDVEAGKALDSSFQSHLDEVRWRAELLNRDIKDKSLPKFLRGTLQGVAFGSVASTGAAAAADAVRGTVDVPSLVARFGVSMVLGTLFAVMFYQPPTRKRRLLRFYDVLTNDRG
jgi:hypothetical protein